MVGVRVLLKLIFLPPEQHALNIKPKAFLGTLWFFENWEQLKCNSMQNAVDELPHYQGMEIKSDTRAQLARDRPSLRLLSWHKC